MDYQSRSLDFFLAGDKVKGWLVIWELNGAQADYFGWNREAVSEVERNIVGVEEIKSVWL